MINNGHDLFTLVHHGTVGDTELYAATCVCGEPSPRAPIGQVVRWFGMHTYSAALDRAIQLLKS